MGKHGNNALNMTKNNTTPTKIIDPTTARLEQSNTDEAEENDLKNNTQQNCQSP